MMSIAVAASLWVFLVRIRGNTTLLILMNVPATLLHELAHWSVALLTGARPSLPSIWPSRAGDGWELGSVTFEVRTLSCGLVALAPLMLAPWAVWGLCYREIGSLQSEFISGIIFGYMAWGSLPSSTDWVLALRYPFGAVVALGILAMTAGVLLGL